jgi:DNA-binding transcriptional ArsR family regulator
MNTTVTEEHYTLLSDQLKAMADPTRLRILYLLPATKKCELVYNVSELAEELGITHGFTSSQGALQRRVDQK